MVLSSEEISKLEQACALANQQANQLKVLNPSQLHYYATKERSHTFQALLIIVDNLKSVMKSQNDLAAKLLAEQSNAGISISGHVLGKFEPYPKDGE